MKLLKEERLYEIKNIIKNLFNEFVIHYNKEREYIDMININENSIMLGDICKRIIL